MKTLLISAEKDAKQLYLRQNYNNDLFNDYLIMTLGGLILHVPVAGSTVRSIKWSSW